MVKLLITAALLLGVVSILTAVGTWSIIATPNTEKEELQALKVWIKGGPDPMHEPERRFCLTDNDCHTYVTGAPDGNEWVILGTCNSAEQRCNDE